VNTIGNRDKSALNRKNAVRTGRFKVAAGRIRFTTL
jgi:hypothetical protein